MGVCVGGGCAVWEVVCAACLVWPFTAQLAKAETNRKNIATS